MLSASLKQRYSAIVRRQIERDQLISCTGKLSKSSRVQIFTVSYFAVLIFACFGRGSRNHKNLDLSKISCYTVSQQCIQLHARCLCSLLFRLIRLGSPNLNNLIGIGAIILYVGTYFFIIPTTDQQVHILLCNLTPWLTALGYSLCYGTILAKMLRVYFIFDNPTPPKKKVGYNLASQKKQNISNSLAIVHDCLCVRSYLLFCFALSSCHLEYHNFVPLSKY